jgi:RND family efflux transporter MFP subunit
MNIWPSVALVLALFAAFALDAARAEEGSPVEELDCVINPSAIVEISSAAPGVLSAVHAERSQRVKQGDLLAELDSGVEQAELDLARVRAELDTMVKLREAGLKYDQRILDRLQAVGGDSVVTQQELDVARREAVLSNWRLQDARDLRHLRRLELVRARAEMARRQVRSPITGVVVQRLRSPGEYVEELPIFRLARLDPLHVEVMAPMGLFGRIVPGMQASVVAETHPDRSYSAAVELVDPMGDAAAGSFGLRLLLANTEHAIPAGVKCRARFHFDQLPGEDPASPASAPGVARQGDMDEGEGPALALER